MEQAGLTHLLVYGDREHFANLAYLTGFDPRFEEALLILGLTGIPLLLVGNECFGYLKISSLWQAGGLRSEKYPPFSLPDQPHDPFRSLPDILAGEGVVDGATVGCVGWKIYPDQPDVSRAMDLPAYLVDAVRGAVGGDQVLNATGIFINPADGLRTVCSPAEIARFEYNSIQAAEGVRRIIFALREGITDYELAAASQYPALPLACHTTVKVGENRTSLASPIGAKLKRGGIFSASIAYWGGHSCRAGWAAGSEHDLPPGYIEQFAGPYFAAMGEWFRRLRIGVSGGEIDSLMRQLLPYDRFGISLNPGHLIHLDEWVAAPIYAGSTLLLRSGMIMQADVIPSSPLYYSTRMEDGYLLADSGLRQALSSEYPDLFARCRARRDFMQDVLGFELPAEVLPLSNIPGMVPPYFLEPRVLFALSPDVIR